MQRAGLGHALQSGWPPPTVKRSIMVFSTESTAVDGAATNPPAHPKPIFARRRWGLRGRADDKRGIYSPLHDVIASRVRGPCTPSTRFSSMSLVAPGPLIMVSGRVASSRSSAFASTSATSLIGEHDAEVVVRNEREDAPASDPGEPSKIQCPGLGDRHARSQ